jgi:PAS domain S-box-containing protein
MRAFRFGNRLDRGIAANILLALDAGVPLHDALADALDDPSLEIVYRLGGDRAGWVDEAGRDVEEPCATPGRAVTMIERNGRRIAALVHDPGLADRRETVDLVASAAGLPLENTRLQAELRSQFDFLRTLVDTAPSLFVHLDTEGRIVNQNVAAVEAAGEEDEEAIRGQHFWDVFIDPLGRDEVRSRFEAAAPEHPTAEYEDTFVNARGERRIVFWRSAPLRDERGRTRGIIVGGIDITERQEQAEARERERVFLNAIANEAPSLLCLIDENGVLAPMASNKAFERSLEVRPEETGGTVFWETYIAPEDASRVRSLVGRVAAGESVGYNDNTWITSSGRRLSVSWSCIRLPSIDERRLLLVSGVDVTERRQRELQLQHERDITSTLMQAIPSIVCVVDREGVIVDSGVDPARAAVNEAFRDALGWPDGRIVHTSVLDLIDAADGYFARMAIASAANGVASAQRESRWQRADGDRIVVAWTATPVADVTGREPSLVLLSGNDVTERRRQEEEIRASRARIIEAADDARRVLERNLHDGAQQRLVALSVSLRLAESRAATDPVATEAILRAAREELAAALEELRELARGIHPAVLTDRGLAAAVEALVARTPLAVTVAMPDERLPASIEAAAYYVVAEAITNVVKYAGASTVDVAVTADETCVTVEVTDDGCGGADPEAGTGLRGLRDRVAALDGTLVVASPADRGTRVVAEIPLAPRPGLAL